MKVVVTGATGFIGSELVPALCERGDSVVVLSRNGPHAKEHFGASSSKPRDIEAVTADLEEPGAWTEALACDAIIHLAGESVAAKRWDAREKQILRDSRVETTRVIVEAIAKLPQRPRVLVCASGADYYPFDDDEDEYTESAQPGDSFLARLCRDWEAEAREAEQYGVRVVCMRTGLVLGKGGGLEKMTTPFKFFVGGRIGSGKQWMPWMHIDDAVGAYVAAVHDDRYKGPINMVTDAVRNRDFARALGKAMHRPSWLPVPKFAGKAAAGELADYVLNGRRAVPAKLRALGFTWKQPELAEALASSVRGATSR
jgi:uncharacterized protein (TIGR01777 family)